MDDERSPFHKRLHEVIFGAETPSGKTFDVALMVLTILSVIAVLLESVVPVRTAWGQELRIFEWLVTGLFTVE
jgi:voltage-gated potassium channel